MVAQVAGPNLNGILCCAIVQHPGDLMPSFQRVWAGIVGCGLSTAVVGLWARATRTGSSFCTSGNHAHSAIFNPMAIISDVATEMNRPRNADKDM
jgi:hypothetical protein